MALKTICSVPLDWTLENYLEHRCNDGSHFHITRSQLREHESRNIVKFLRRSGSNRETDVVQIQTLAVRDDRWAGRPSRSRTAGSPMNTGLSYRVGPYLAKRVRQRQLWAIVMLSQIRNRPADERFEEEQECSLQ